MRLLSKKVSLIMVRLLRVDDDVLDAADGQRPVAVALQLQWQHAAQQAEEGDRVLFGLPFEVGDDVTLPSPFGGNEDGVLEQGRGLVGHARSAATRLRLSQFERSTSHCFRLSIRFLDQCRIVLDVELLGYICAAAEDGR